MLFAKRQPNWCRWLLPALLALALAGCGRDRITSYRVPKERNVADEAMASSGMENTASPGIAWVLPPGWQESPVEEMSIANFNVTGTDAQKAGVAVMQFPKMDGMELQFVNLWRDKVKLPPVTPGDPAAQPEKIPIGAGEGRLYDLAGKEPADGSKSPAHILVALFTQGETSWAVRMQGEDSLVREQRPAFLQFLKSVTFPAAGATTLASRERPPSTNAKQTPHETADAGGPAWKPPGNWQQLPTPPMLQAKYLVPGTGSAKAEVNISAAGGSVPMNVNRWRGQLGLAPLDESAMQKALTPLNVPGSQAILVDMSGTDARTGQPARLVAAIVPRGEQSWFYKLMGDGKVVETEKPAFIQFVEQVKYPNEP